MILLLALGVVLAVPMWTMLRWEPPEALTPSVAMRYLLMCCACLLLSLLARGDTLLMDWWAWTMGASILFTGLLVIVLWSEVKLDA